MIGFGVGALWLSVLLGAAGGSSAGARRGRPGAGSLELGPRGPQSYAARVAQALQRGGECAGALAVRHGPGGECRPLGGAQGCAPGQWLLLSKPREQASRLRLSPLCAERKCADSAVWWASLQECVEGADSGAVCGRGAVLRSDVFGDGYCACPPKQGQIKEGADCHEFYQQGPCEDDEVFVYDSKTTYGHCTRDLCHKENMEHKRKRRAATKNKKPLPKDDEDEEVVLTYEEALAAELKARADEEKARAKELEARIAEEKRRAAELKRREAAEILAREVEEKAREAELKARAAEEEVRAKELKIREAEEKKRAAELKVREAAEKKARAEELKARAEELKQRAIEAEARAEEEQLRAEELELRIATEEAARLAELKARAKEEEARAKEEKIRAAELETRAKQEERTKTAEQKARELEEEARAAEKEARENEEKIRAAEMGAKLSVEKRAKLTEAKAREAEAIARAREAEQRAKEQEQRAEELEQRAAEEAARAALEERYAGVDLSRSKHSGYKFAPLNGKGRCLELQSFDGCSQSKHFNDTNIFIIHHESNLPVCIGVSSLPVDADVKA